MELHLGSFWKQMVVSPKPQHRPEFTIVLIVGATKKVFNFGKPNTVYFLRGILFVCYACLGHTPQTIETSLHPNLDTYML